MQNEINMEPLVQFSKISPPDVYLKCFMNSRSANTNLLGNFLGYYFSTKWECIINKN